MNKSPKPPKPTKRHANMMSNMSMSVAQARRLASGQSGMSDDELHERNARLTDQDRALREARRAIEDRRIARELGL